MFVLFVLAIVQYININTIHKHCDKQTHMWLIYACICCCYCYSFTLLLSLWIAHSMDIFGHLLSAEHILWHHNFQFSKGIAVAFFAKQKKIYRYTHGETYIDTHIFTHTHKYIHSYRDKDVTMRQLKMISKAVVKSVVNLLTTSLKFCWYGTKGGQCGRNR